MTVSSTDNRWSYQGNGSTAGFPYTNRIFAAGDLKVYVDGALRILGSHYTVSNVGVPSGGHVAFAVPPADGTVVLLVRDVPPTQGLDLVSLGSFPAEENEKALDRLTVLVQQLIDVSQRTLRQPLSDAANLAALPARDGRKGKLLQFNATTGDPEAATAVAQTLLAGDGIAIDGGTIAIDPSGVAAVAPAGGDGILLGDASDGAALKVALLSDILALVAVTPTVSPQNVDFAAGSTTGNTLYTVAPAGASADGTLPAAAAVASGFTVRVKNETDGKSVRILRAGSDTIDGQAAIRVPGREEVEVIRTAAGTWTITKRPAHRVGEVIEWATDTLPEGGFAWLNAQALSRSTYRGLFDEWGTTYGAGDGATTFNVRDDRGRVKAGKDDMGGASAANRLTSGGSGIAGATLGASGGAQTHTLTTTEMPAHTHTQTGHSAVGGSISNFSQAETAGSQAMAHSTQSAGGGSAHQNTQPTIITNFIVKT